VASPVAILRGQAGGVSAPGNPLQVDVFVNRYHQSGMNFTFCDGHAKWTKWQNTFQRDPANASRLLWTMWDRRLGKT
jgi:prepilin-type processing-associated H-X9-DG protein